jgi:flagellar capping protein FliD
MTELETKLLEALKTLQDEQEQRNSDLMALWNERETRLNNKIDSLAMQSKDLQHQLAQQQQQIAALLVLLDQYNKRMKELAES